MNVLITGAAGGIGAATADLFLARGWRVFALDISPVPARDGLESFCADVTCDTDLTDIAARLSDRGIALDAMVLTAGIHRMASLVEAPPNLLKRVLDVNVAGTMQTVRAFHSLLCDKGRIVLVTSEVATLDPLPFNGLYSVSKIALEAYAQALRQELGLLGQTVVTVRPGAIATPLCADSLALTEQLAAQTVLYKGEAHRFLSLTRAFMGEPLAPERVAPLLYRAATALHVRTSYAIHRNLGMVLLSCLPKCVQCFLIQSLLRNKLFSRFLERK